MEGKKEMRRTESAIENIADALEELRAEEAVTEKTAQGQEVPASKVEDLMQLKGLILTKVLYILQHPQNLSHCHQQV